jgi:dipeptidyl aminopeptidase/acylaminoacyl peptidase
VRSLTPCAMVASMTVAALGLAAAIPASASASNALNGRIAYTTHGINGTGEIVTIDPDGAAPLRLTENPGYDAQADWAPDGLDLVYRSTPTTTGFEVWRMDRYGEHETRLTFGQSLSVDAYSSSQPAWFPDKSRILFRASGGPFAHAPIFSMAPEPGAEKQLVLQRDFNLWYPTLSPDMRRLLVATQYGSINRHEDRGIEVANGTGPPSWQAPFTEPLVTLFDGPKTAPGVYDSAGAWSPDGTQIAFESDVDGDMDIYVIQADGSDMRQLTGVEPDANAHDEGPAWSPDGRQIAFTSGPSNLEGDIHVMNADGSDLRRLTFNEDPRRGWARDESPDWQLIPIGEDLRALGDLTRQGPGAYSVHAGGALADERALRLAGRWVRSAERGRAPRRLGGFKFATEPAGYGALIVRGRRHRPWWSLRANAKRVVFLYRGSDPTGVRRVTRSGLARRSS